MSFPFLPAPDAMRGLSARLAVVLGGLQAAVAAWAGRDRSVVPLVWLTWARLARTIRRFDSLMRRLAAGRAARRPAGGQRASGRTAPAADAASPVPAGMRLPRGDGWLLRRLQVTAAFRSQLLALLEDPAMAALLAAEPRAGRILRPLCRMLLIAPGPGLALPPLPAAPSVAPPCRAPDYGVTAPPAADPGPAASGRHAPTRGPPGS